MNDKERTPFFSIVIPVYNVEKYINECIQSVVYQDFRDIQIIIVIDGSPDNSKAICEKYRNQDKRIVIVEQKNQGVAVARNHGLEIATGKYVHFVDPDDRLPNSTVYSKLYALLKDEHTDVLIGKSSYYENEFLEKVEDGISFDESFDGNCLSYLLEKKMFFALTSGCNKIFNVSFLKRNKLFWPLNIINEDDRWLPQVFSFCTHMKFSSTEIYDVRRRPQSLCSTVDSDKLVLRGKGNIETAKTNLQLIQQEPITKTALGNGTEYYVREYFNAMRMVFDNKGDVVFDYGIVDTMRNSNNGKMRLLYVLSKLIGKRNTYRIMLRRYGINQ